MKKNVAVLMGGYSSEHEISVLSGNTVFSNIDCNLYNPYKVIIDSESWNLIDSKNKKFPIQKDTFNLAVDGKEINFDIVFIMVHGTPGEDGIIQKYFEKLQIPYTGPSSDVASLTFDKKKCTDFAKKNNIKTAKSELITKNSNTSIDDIHKKLNFPLFVKANNSGSSYGISKVYNRRGLSSAIKKSFQFDREVLIEEFLNGKEVSVGVMNYKNEIKVFGITEIVTTNDFFDYEAKYEGKHKDFTPAKINMKLEYMLKNQAEEIYRILKIPGFSRIDFIVESNIIYFLEINTIPGMTNQSIFPKQVALKNIKLKDLFTEIIQNKLK